MMAKNYRLENDAFLLEFNRDTGNLASFVVKSLNEDILGEKRLAGLFSLRLQLPGYECNYSTVNTPDSIIIKGDAAEIRFNRVHTEKGAFPVSLCFTITLDGAAVRFRSRLENKSRVPVAEFWYPCLGGWTSFGPRQNTEFFWPGYFGAHYTNFLTRFPTGLRLGDTVPEVLMSCSKPPYPSMPWFDVYNKTLDKGLYFGYHDEQYRIHAHRFGFHPCVGPNVPGDNWPKKEQLGADAPIGLSYAHIRFPYTCSGDSKTGDVFDAGEFVIYLHDGDWHDAAPFYRTWFDRHVSLLKEPTWLRKKTTWLSVMLLQPEDRINTDYKGALQWAKDAKEYGIDTVEICAWDKGGQDRDYPEYVPDERLGGEPGFKQLIKDLDAAGINPVIFANYNAVDCTSAWYKRELHKFVRMDEFGGSENWMAWGQSTIQARHAYSVRRQLWASASIPEFNDIIVAYFTKLAEWGVRAIQLDKTGASEQLLDFNPRSTRPPDTSMAEGTIRSCEYILKKCREIRPDFCFASEANSTRYLSYIDVFYRGPTNQSMPVLRYVFPEWTACLHVGSPFDFAGVNAAVRFGCVLNIEPQCYQASPKHPFYQPIMKYVREINRLREELKDFIFWAAWLDDRDAQIIWQGAVIRGKMVARAKDIGGVALLDAELPQAQGEVPLVFSTHKRFDDNRHSLVVVNNSQEPQSYRFRFTHRRVKKADLYAPFAVPRAVTEDEELSLEADRLHILIEN